VGYRGYQGGKKLIRSHSNGWDYMGMDANARLVLAPCVYTYASITPMYI
jgi:hypothetical protein